MEYIFLITGLIVGAAVLYLWAKPKFSAALSQEEISEKYVLKEVHAQWVEQHDRLKEKAEQKDQEIITLTSKWSSTQEKLEQTEKRLSELKEETDANTQKLKNDFKVLAHEILESNSKKFTEQNKSQIDGILEPFKEKLHLFEKKVEETYVKGREERGSLKTEVKNLMEMNQKLSNDANNLTKALKGDVKTQGNWGEVILERILEKSGLVKDREYFVQNSITTEDGKRFQPDVIIHLPDSKRVIVDSKVSLVAYEKFSSADSLDQQKDYIKEHLLSVKAHVKGLSDKNYQNLYGIDGLDFVLMFIPIEGAFSLAMQNDNSLFQEAFDKNVVIVSTSTLLATLRTIESIWKQEHQNQNALEIAKQGGNLFDKFVGFTEDLIKLGKQLNTSKTTYDDAMNKLSEGSGNLVRRAENLKKLGVKATKKLNQRLLDRSDDALDA